MHAGTSARVGRLMLLLPLLLAGIAAVVLLVFPTGRYESGSAGPGGVSVQTTGSTTLVQSDGWGVLVPLSIPVVIAGVPLALSRTRWRRGALVAASVLLVIFVVLGAASVGLFYLPAAVATVAAAIVDARGGQASGELTSR